jgi:type II secretion system protein N
MVFILLVWYVSIPDDLLKEEIEDSVSNSQDLNINASVKGFKKGLFFTFNAEGLDLKRGDIPVLSVTDISGRLNPLYLLKKELALSIKGKIGTGDIVGHFKLPAYGSMSIKNASLISIPYLTGIGIESNGYISADILLKENAVQVVFEVPDLDIKDPDSMTIPFITSIRRIQGAFSIKGGTIKLDSTSLEGEIGYARLKGSVKNGLMDLVLELMPSPGRVKQAELMIIEKYMVSPGYYVIPLKGPLM